MKTYYKIFEKLNDKKSYYSYAQYRTTILRYFMNDWTLAPNDSRLFVFDNIESLKTYITCLGYRPDDFYVYECHCKGVIKNANGTRGSKNVSFSLYDSYKEFWDKVNRNLKRKKKWNFGIDKCFAMHDHKGVCFAKEVKLVNRIEI
jgi:hypothetical protein